MRKILRILLPVLVVALVIVVVLSRCNPNTPVSSVAASSTTSSTNGSSSEGDTQQSTAEEVKNIEYKPTATGIYVARDGSIRTAEITDFSNNGFDKVRYDLDTLRSYVTGWIDNYNQAKGKTSVAIDTIAATDETATLVLSYDSINSFMDFQGEDYGITSLKVGPAEFAARNFALSGLKDTEGNNVTPIDALQDESVTVVAVSGSCLVSFAGEIKYLSHSLTLVDANTVRLNSKSEAFIIFK